MTLIPVVRNRLAACFLAGAMVLALWPAPSKAIGSVLAPEIQPSICVVYGCATVTISLAGNGSGTVTNANGDFDCRLTLGVPSGTCSHQFVLGTKGYADVSVDLTPAVGSGVCAYFGCTSMAAHYSFALKADTTQYITFDIRKLTVVVTKSGDGTGTVTSGPPGIACGATCSTTVAFGTNVALAAKPDAGAVFTAWTGACAGQAATCSLAITDDTSTNAVFSLPTASPSPSPSPSPTSSPPLPLPGPTVGTPQVLLLAPGPVTARTVPAKVRWTLVSSTSPVVAYQLQVRTNGGSWTEVGLSSALATSALVPLSIGVISQFRVRAADSGGRTGTWTNGPAEKTAAYQENASAVAYAGSWSTRTSASYWSGHVKEATKPSSSATLRFSGWGVEVVGSTGPSEGSARIYVDGVLAKTVSLFALSAKTRQVVYSRSWATNASHSVTLVVVGTGGHPAIDIDGFAILH